MARKQPIRPHLYGNGDVAVSRYFALYVAQAGWLVLGVFLLANAYWPSICQPQSFVEIYECSALLADNRGWVESALMTWLWATPILLVLEGTRHYNRLRSRR